MSPTRETSSNRLASIGIASWAILFAVLIGLLGDKVTSKQWQYLMLVPGGKWTYFILFGLAGTISVIGWFKHRYICLAIGLISNGFFCMGIMAFYITAPAFIDDLITLGWLPWLLCSGISFYFGAINQSSREW